MEREIVFEDSDLGEKRMGLAWDGLRFGTLRAQGKDLILLQQGKSSARNRDVKRREVAIRRALKAISLVEPSDKENDDSDQRVMKRGDGDQRVVLDQPQLKLLMDYGWDVPWRPQVEEDAQDMLDFLCAAQEASGKE